MKSPTVTVLGAFAAMSTWCAVTVGSAVAGPVGAPSGPATPRSAPVPVISPDHRRADVERSSRSFSRAAARRVDRSGAVPLHPDRSARSDPLFGLLRWHQRVMAFAPRPRSTPGNREGSDPVSSSVWDRLADCEATGDWSINTGNGYYGGLQFSLSSWRAVGGSGYPHHASRSEQIARGVLLQARSGWGAWPSCSAQLGLR